MAPISLKMLLHNKARSLAAVVGISVAFFLSAAQVGLLVGWCNTISAIMRHADVDVWVMAAQNPAFDYGTPIPRQRLYQVRTVPGVSWAEAMYQGWVFWRRPDGRMTNIELIGLDDSLAGGPWSMQQNTPAVVHEPNAVITDVLYRSPLGVNHIDDEVEIGDRRAVIRGFSREIRTFTAAPFVFSSITSALSYDPRYRADEITYVLARCEPGVAPPQLRDAIAQEVPSVQVLTSDEFQLKTILYWMLETGIGLTIIMTAVLGIVVGTVIISQTLYAITNDHLPNYATLLAIGFSRQQLIGLVLIQAVVLGMIGILLGSAFFGRAAQMSQGTPIPIETTPAVFGGIMTAFLVSCLAAATFSIRSIFSIDPVQVFRN
jgi:putative ABC transport system permease protein